MADQKADPIKNDPAVTAPAEAELEDELLDADELEEDEDIENPAEDDDYEDDDYEEDEFDDEEELPAPIFDGMESEEKVRLMASIADSIRASDIQALDLRGLTIIADFFLLATGKSSIQIRAIADRIEEKLRNIGIRKLRVEGYQEATWILLDYGDVVVHVMAEEQRAFYNLEGFWSEAARLELVLAPELTTLAGITRDAGL